MKDSTIIHTSDAAFDRDVVTAAKPVLVDFWAEWCGPCKMIGPILEQAADTFQDQLTVAKLNVDENPQIPAKFNVRGIPTLMLFKNGVLKAQKVGAVTQSQLAAFLNAHL